MFDDLLTILLCVLLVWNLTTTTDDSKIQSGKNIKIDNAVYQCTKTQELILK